MNTPAIRTVMTSQRIKRVLVPLSGQQTPAGVLDHAADMAAKLQSELCGLFIEDSDLLNFAQLPVGREISFSTGRIQTSSMSSMERSLRQSANRSQQEITKLATHYKIQSQFVTRRGHTQQTVQMEVQIDDLLILSGQGQQATNALLKQAYDFLQSGHLYLAWLPAVALPVGEITVVQDNSPAADQSMELAKLLANDSGHSVTTMPYADVDPLKGKLQSVKQALWIVPYQQEWDLKVLEQLLGKSRSPVLVVNA